MLNENESHGGEDHTSCCDEDDSVYSLVSEGKSNQLNLHKEGGNEANTTANIAKLGLLILDGEEEEEPGDNEGIEKELGKEASTLLSVPDTVFLPSEIRSVLADSSIRQQEANMNEVEANQDSNNFASIVQEKWRQMLSLVSDWMSSANRINSFNTMHISTVVLVFMTLMATYASWQTHVWRREALSLREELNRQQHETVVLREEKNSGLNKVLSLMEERDVLIKKQQLLEEVIEGFQKYNSSGGYKSEDIFSDESDDESFLTLQNCYIKATLSLGQCSKEWQRWWSANGEDTKNEETYEDGFTDDMARLVKGLKGSFKATTTQSISYIEKAMKDLSYDGIKDTLSGMAATDEAFEWFV